MFSNEMTEKLSSDKFQIINDKYLINSYGENEFDCIILSYIFTLSENSYLELIQSIKHHSKNNSFLAVVDFHSASILYDHFMKSRKIDIDPNLFYQLKSDFNLQYESSGNGWLKLWKWKAGVYVVDDKC